MLLRRAAADRYEIGSAGSDPIGSPDGVAAVLREIAIREVVSSRRALSSALHPPPDLLVTVCEEGCGSWPYVPGARRVVGRPEPDPDQVLPDRRVNVLRHIRDHLQLHVAMLVNLLPI